MAYTGLRPEEALALRWEDVGRTVHVHRAYTHGEEKGTKTGRGRSVEVMAALADDLARWREVTPWGESGDLVCPSLGRADRPADAERQGGFLHLGNWRNRIFKPAAERAGLAGVVAYNGRDTFTSGLITNTETSSSWPRTSATPTRTRSFATTPPSLPRPSTGRR